MDVGAVQGQWDEYYYDQEGGGEGDGEVDAVGYYGYKGKGKGKGKSKGKGKEEAHATTAEARRISQEIARTPKRGKEKREKAKDSKECAMRAER